MFKAVVIDDETKARKTISGLLNLFVDNITIVGEGDNVKSGIAIIQEQKPDIVFLDVQMPDGTGFDLLEHFKNNINFKIIFVTAHENYALKAFNFHAFDYILKPLSPDRLKEAVTRAVNSLSSNNNVILNTYLENSKASNKKKKIVLKTADSITLVNIEDIIRLESDGSYTYVHLREKKKILVSTNLKEYEELLSDLGFFRIHKTHLINLNHIFQFQKSDGGFVKMNDDTVIPVSRRKKDELLHIMDTL